MTVPSFLCYAKDKTSSGVVMNNCDGGFMISMLYHGAAFLNSIILPSEMYFATIAWLIATYLQTEGYSSRKISFSHLP